MKISLGARLFSLIYEGLLLAAVGFLSLIPAAAVAFVLRDFPRLGTFAVGIVILAAWYFYCMTAWKRGQTLAMKTWHIRLRDAHGGIPSGRRLRLRWMWATVFLLFLPGMVYTLARARGFTPGIAAGLSLLWWILPWGWAWVHPSGQRLYDVLAGTVLRRDS